MLGCDYRHFLNMKGLQSPYNVQLQTAAAKLPNDGGSAEVEMGMAMAGLLLVSICEVNVNVVGGVKTAPSAASSVHPSIKPLLLPFMREEGRRDNERASKFRVGLKL